MMQIVFLLEGPSEEEMLRGLLPKLMPQDIIDNVLYVVFEGKRDLDKRLPRRLRAWQHPSARFVVIRDQDSGDRKEIKANLATMCANSGRPETLIRIACHELETFYLGDLAAVGEAIGPKNIEKQQNKAKFRNPDQLINPKQELKKIAPDYQPVAGSRAIGPLLSLERNRSPSFNALIAGIQGLIG